MQAVSENNQITPSLVADGLGGIAPRCHARAVITARL
jgi:hypothetical protein